MLYYHLKGQLLSLSGMLFKSRFLEFEFYWNPVQNVIYKFLDQVMYRIFSHFYYKSTILS